MSDFAIIPWTVQFENDKIFEVKSPINRDNLLEPYLEMKQEFERMGHAIHTIDFYDDFNDIDYYLFFSLNWEIYDSIIRSGNASKMVYCTAEPPSVYWYNSPKGYHLLKHIFPYILTWNDSWVDNVSIFKRNLPYWFVDQRDGNLPFKEKKLITSISGNKYSKYKGELYSERRKAISFFENKYASDFKFYGVGWSPIEHPCYGGKAENKAQIFHQYRFAICYENIEGLNGYVTEKILDCLMSGIVPIYAGAADITNYVPEGCYIKLRDYDNYSELYNYISNMREEDYNKFLLNAKVFLESPKSNYFSGSRYAHYILDAVGHDKSDFRMSKIAFKAFNYANYLYNIFLNSQFR